MVFIQPHIPWLSPYDVAECLWGFATLQPPNWRTENSHLLCLLIRRLLTPTRRCNGTARLRDHRSLPSSLREADSTDSAQRDEDYICLAAGETGADCRSEGAAKKTEEEEEESIKSAAGATGQGEDGIRGMAELTGKLHEEVELSWVEGKGFAGKRKEQRREHGVLHEEELLLYGLPNLMLYRILFGLAKLDFRCRLSQSLFQAAAPLGTSLQILIYSGPVRAL